jgi:hypothetical protein
MVEESDRERIPPPPGVFTKYSKQRTYGIKSEKNALRAKSRVETEGLTGLRVTLRSSGQERVKKSKTRRRKQRS